jgi:hypothetical protein
MNSASHLRNLLHQRQIVQHYPPSDPEDLLPLPALACTPPRHFYEDQIFDELERTAIVEDYLPYVHHSHHRMEDHY